MRIVVFVSLFLISSQLTSYGQCDELYRPQFHFSPEKNWLNDPNGLVYYKGIYHLFYQYNPFGDQWGNMSWGHATSTDLIHFEEQAVAIPFQDGVMAFSGSAVVDWNNTSGFGLNGEPPIVAIYTGLVTSTGYQDQRIAFSNDGGFTWSIYNQNPVIDINSNEFRDPKVIWHEATQKWIMVVSLGNNRKIRFYRSDDLKNWEFLQDFGPEGNTAGVWECPDFFALPVDGNLNNEKWVLVHSIGPGAAQYFIGDFNGQEFIWDGSTLPTSIVIEDFESGNYDNWSVDGNAFGQFPASGTLPNQQAVSGYLGEKLVNSFLNGDITQGRLISKNFTIQENYINFLIGGGNHADGTYIKLVVENEVVHSSTGLNDEFLAWDTWDVTDYVGQLAHIEIIDSITGGWGHINIDHIIQTASPVATINKGIIDYGKDFYAVQSFSDIPESDGRRIWLAWMNNWSYAENVPTSPWRGMMSIAREVNLRTINGQVKLVQNPVKELEKLHTDSVYFQNESIEFIDNYIKDKSYKIYELKGSINKLGSNSFELSIKKGIDQKTQVLFDFENNEIRLDRSNSGDLTWNQIFSDAQAAPLNSTNDTIDFQLIVDNCSIELFVNGGQVVFSNQIFPDSTSYSIELSSENPSLTFNEFVLFNFEDNIPTTLDAFIEIQQDAFKIYPNPLGTIENIIVEVDKKIRGRIILSVFSHLGQKLYQIETKKKSLVIPNEVFLSDGLYFVNIQNNSNSFNKKLIVYKNNK